MGRIRVSGLIVVLATGMLVPARAPAYALPAGIEAASLIAIGSGGVLREDAAHEGMFTIVTYRRYGTSAVDIKIGLRSPDASRSYEGILESAEFFETADGSVHLIASGLKGLGDLALEFRRVESTPYAVCAETSPLLVYGLAGRRGGRARIEGELGNWQVSNTECAAWEADGVVGWLTW